MSQTPPTSNHVPVKVLHLDYEFPPIGGGGGKAHQQILKQFRNNTAFDITLITTTTRLERYEEHYSDTVRIIYLPIKKQSLHYWKRSEVIAYLWTHHRLLKQHLKQNTYDLCHVFFGFPSGALAYFQRGCFPYIVSVRGSDVPGYNQRFGMDYKILSPLLHRIYHKAGAVVANSRGLKELFDSHYSDLNAAVIPNGIEIEEYTPKESANPVLKIVCVARLIPRKGVHLLLDACKQLSGKKHLFEAHIIGEGPEMSNLQQQAETLDIKKNTFFHGRLERDEITRLLPMFDVFALPSYAEGMPNAALEAMACGLPLILSNTGGAQELVKNNGKIITKGNANALAEAIEFYIKSPQEIMQQGRASREHAQNFTWQRVAGDYAQLYLNCLQKARP